MTLPHFIHKFSATIMNIIHRPVDPWLYTNCLEYMYMYKVKSTERIIFLEGNYVASNCWTPGTVCSAAIQGLTQYLHKYMYVQYVHMLLAVIMLPYIYRPITCMYYIIQANHTVSDTLIHKNKILLVYNISINKIYGGCYFGQLPY